MENNSGNNKIFVLLPDGVSLRNFAFTNFHETGQALGFDVVFWNRTAFNLKDLGYKEMSMPEGKEHPLTDILKMSRRLIELHLRKKHSGDPVYASYIFKLPSKGIKAKIKSALVTISTKVFGSRSGVGTVRNIIFSKERQTAYYQKVYKILASEKPAMVFCTSQRDVKAIAPVLAAKDLNIPTAVFIFSWDNLPKATLQVEGDYYFVWSEHMKKELLHYYPFITENQVFVTGTPQFETHFDSGFILPRAVFFKIHNLNPEKKYICYSGDDVTTSPNDPLYLSNTAEAVRELNAKGHNLGIVFRRCPVDFSKRFDAVIEKYKDVIVVIDPEWQAAGNWGSVMPTVADLYLQMNTINNTEMVINLGSSMVFDYVAFQKPCAYINYDYPIANAIRKHWSVAKTYNFVHFRSMPSKDTVFWINSAPEIGAIIEKALTDKEKTVSEAQQWFEKINQSPPQNASLRIFEACKNIISTRNG
jgi:hypothetical protein